MSTEHGMNCANGKAEKSLGINATYIQQQTEDKFITQGASKN